MKRFYSIIVLGGLIFASCNNEQEREIAENPHMDTTGSAADTTSTNFSLEDSSFLVETLSSNIMEVQLGELAIKKSKQESTRELGKMMIQDHSKAKDEIRMLLQQRNIAVPDSLINQHKSKIQEFEMMKAAEFDKKYIQEMQKDHREDISKFKSQLNRTSHSGIKEFVNGTLPVLQKHQTHIETLVNE